MVVDGLRNLMLNLVPASDAVNKGIGRGSVPVAMECRTIGVDFTILPWSIVSREIIIVHVDLRLGMTIFVSHSSHLGTRVITTLPLLEGLLRLEITGTMVLRCLALVILMTIDAVLHLRTGTGTPRSHRPRPRRKSIEVAFLLMILVIAVAMVMPHIRLLRHPMIGMTIEEVIVTEITFHCLPEVALHLVVGMTLIGCLRGSMLTTVAGHRLHHVILILVGRLNPRQDIGAVLRVLVLLHTNILQMVMVVLVLARVLDLLLCLSHFVVIPETTTILHATAVIIQSLLEVIDDLRFEPGSILL